MFIFSSPMAKLGSKTRVILCPKWGHCLATRIIRQGAWEADLTAPSLAAMSVVQKGPRDWQPRSLALHLDVYHLRHNSGSSIRMSWHSSALMWAYHLCRLFPASRNRWDPHDANPDLGSVQVTDVWGGLGEQYSLQGVSTELSKARHWGLGLAQLGEGWPIYLSPLPPNPTNNSCPEEWVKEDQQKL